MKLLICTQAVDKNHPILGFFHRWIEEFARRCEVVHVVCLFEGDHSLPPNVQIHSLGKETGESKVKYLIRFYSLIWKLRTEYDSVFVHMNQVYVILGAPLWRLLGKKIGLWYAHGTVPLSLRMAIPFTHTIFTSTEEGMRIETPKRIIVGQGIDTEIFTSSQRQASKDLRLITVGRISPSKNIETLLHACALLKNKNAHFTFRVVGVALIPEEQQYEQKMRSLVTELGLNSEVIWHGSVANHRLPEVLQASDIFIHDGATNSLDKALVEASLCGCKVISSNAAYTALTSVIAPEYVYPAKDATQLAKRVEEALKHTHNSADAVESYFREKYSIAHLISRIVTKH